MLFVKELKLNTHIVPVCLVLTTCYGAYIILVYDIVIEMNVLVNQTCVRFTADEAEDSMSHSDSVGLVSTLSPGFRKCIQVIFISLISKID